MFQNSKYYFNRELSWLKFNHRVLQEAIDKNNPLLERLRFLGIGSSNLDEFFMIRVAGLRHQEQNGVVKYDAAHMDARAQLKAIDESTKRLVKVQYSYLHSLLKQLEGEGLALRRIEELDEEERAYVTEYFNKFIYPVVTPLAVDSGHPFPFLVNRTMHTVVSLHKESDLEKARKIAIIPIPSVLDRLIEIESSQKELRKFVTLESVINYHGEAFFKGYVIDDMMTFRVTRDADLDIDEEEVTDLLREIEKSLRRRRRGQVVRLEVEGEGHEVLLDFILENTQLTKNDVYYIQGLLDLTGLMQFCNQSGYDHLRYAPFEGRTKEAILGDQNIFDAIRERDIVVHHPFDSFSIVEDFILEAALDPSVLAIKQTLYRVSGDSPIIGALMKAADSGKQVTVLMEVKARFDEENNITMARRLEKAGCHVIYGLKGLKTHSKITMVIRREESTIRRYVHLSTGNYNGKTARLYTDVGLFTCKESFSDDGSAFFNLISGYSDSPKWNQLVVAPINLRQEIMSLIDREIEEAKQGRPAKIIGKMNSLLDKQVISKLYEASAAGVDIELIIRGICTLRPGIPGVSERITVKSIVGRFLEHHRIFYFYHGGDEKIYISSADWMPRNLNDRVELMTPIVQEDLKDTLHKLLQDYLRDNQKSHVMRADGSYRKIIAKDHKWNVQDQCLEAIKREDREALPVYTIYGKNEE